MNLDREMARRMAQAILAELTVFPPLEDEPLELSPLSAPPPFTGSPLDETGMRRLVCELGQKMWQRGFCAGNDGNLSVRLHENAVLVTPTGVSKGALTPEMLCLTDLAGKVLVPNSHGWKPTSEVLLHLAIYRQRPDVRAVIHAHIPHATAWAVAGRALPEAIHPEAEYLLGHVPLVPYVMPGQSRLGQEAAVRLRSDTVAMLLARHGAVTFHADPLEAYYRLEVLENYCRLLFLLQQAGPMRPMTAAELLELLEMKERAGLRDSRLPALRAGTYRVPAFGAIDREALIDKVCGRVLHEK